MSRIASRIACFARSPQPSGFSFDANLMMSDSFRPSSRATSEIGLPG